MQASEQTVNILGFHTTTLCKDALLSLIESWLTRKEASHHLMALNPIKVCRARKEPELAGFIRNADMVYPDAYGIAWAMTRFTGKKFKPIAGCDLMYDIFRLADKHRLRIFLLGAKESVITEAQALIRNHYPSLIVAGARNGYFRDNDEIQATTERILQANPDIVLVGMGAVIQEGWIERLMRAAGNRNRVIPLLMGVGGSFDALTGHVPRPPKWMLSLHLEWLYRLIKQPLRAPRMLALPHFAVLVLGKKFLKLKLDCTI